jgi:hypothetical protein
MFRMELSGSPVIWGAIAALVVVAVLLAIFGGAIGAIICAVVAIALVLFFGGRRR